jgi:GntR family transcriptional repressor for pyruvate dehydrogenase complex
VIPVAGTEVADEISRYITERGYAFGDRLPSERELATRLGISRPTVRQALAALVQARLVVARERSGTYVGAVDLQELVAVRLQLEPFAARLAAQKGTRSSDRSLSELLRRARRCVDSAADFADVDSLIHDTVVELAGNRLLASISGDLHRLASGSRVLTAGDLKLRVSTLGHLERLITALRNRDPDGAFTAMSRHLEDVSLAVDEATTHNELRSDAMVRLELRGRPQS